MQTQRGICLSGNSGRTSGSGHLEEEATETGGPTMTKRAPPSCIPIPCILALQLFIFPKDLPLSRPPPFFVLPFACSALNQQAGP